MKFDASISNIAILPNPKAGAGQSNILAQKLSNKLSFFEITHTVFYDQWPTDDILDQYSDAWVIGGDGTINYFLNKYPTCKLAISLFDGGTGNDFAWKLYGSGNWEKRLNQVLQAKPKFIDAGIVNQQYYINCLGIGFDGEIIQSMQSIRFLGGHFGYLLAVLKKIFSYKEQRLQIQSEDQIWDGKYLLAFFVNSSRAGGGFFIAPNASIDDGKLDMVLCEAIPIWKRLKYLPIIKSGKHLNLPFIKYQLGTSFIIQCEKEMPLQIDGELQFAQAIKVQIKAKSFLFRY